MCNTILVVKSLVITDMGKQVILVILRVIAFIVLTNSWKC